MAWRAATEGANEEGWTSNTPLNLSVRSATGALFGLLTLAHIWRVIEEGPQLAREPWYVLITITAAALCLWAWRLLRRLPRS